jgi:hypothetical protein
MKTDARKKHLIAFLHGGIVGPLTPPTPGSLSICSAEALFTWKPRVVRAVAGRLHSLFLQIAHLLVLSLPRSQEPDWTVDFKQSIRATCCPAKAQAPPTLKLF